MKKLKKITAGALLALSLFTTILPVETHAGVISDGVLASCAQVRSVGNGNYAYGYVTMFRYHTTTVKLYHRNSQVRSAVASGKGKVSASTSKYTAYGTNLSARVFYK